MTSDPPRRWPDDSPAEDSAARRAADLDGLARWGREQKLRPLTDALDAHGLTREPGESWQGPVILPDWWDQVPEPHDQCPWCQRPGVPAPCPECRQAREQAGEPAPTWAYWASLTPALRRLNIAAAYGTDPWSGRHCAIRKEWTDIDSEGQIATTQSLYTGAAPAGIYWGTRRRA